MSGTPQGGRKAKQTIEERYGWLPQILEAGGFYPYIGQIGGRESKGGGFASDKVGLDGLTGKERSIIAGSKGGKISKRPPSGR